MSSQAHSRTERAEIAVGFSDLSIELGHFSADDFAAGPRRITELLRAVAPWAATAKATVAATVSPRRARVSTCLLLDDYFSPLPSPRALVPMLLRAAADAGLTIDYMARESACARDNGVEVAALVMGRIKPPRGQLGDAAESGWLRQRARGSSTEDDRWSDAYEPRRSRSARGSVLVDVQLWSEDAAGTRRWSCPLLAAAWQLARLGALSAGDGKPLVPVPTPDDLPESWVDLPGVVQTSRRATPFAAYRTFSALAGRFLTVEHAVRAILARVPVDPSVAADIAHYGRSDGVVVPALVPDRIDYAFVGGF